MGVIAFVRQSFLDAQHYRDVARSVQGGGTPAADRDRGGKAPALTDDPALAALEPALDRKMPVAFEASEAREIRRALKIAKEFNLEPIVTGARHAPEVADELKAQGARVIYSLNYPTRRRSLAPDADEPIRVLRERADAPKIPGQLAKAGLKFAFESAGLADPKDFVKNAAKAVKAGLPADAAVRALTLDAAAIAGVSDRIGSIEKGKIANLVVTDGDLFEEKSKITHVFVGGRPVPLEPPAAAPNGRGRSARLQPSASVVDLHVRVERLLVRAVGIRPVNRVLVGRVLRPALEMVLVLHLQRDRRDVLRVDGHGMKTEPDDRVRRSGRQIIGRIRHELGRRNAHVMRLVVLVRDHEHEVAGRTAVGFGRVLHMVRVVDDDVRALGGGDCLHRDILSCSLSPAAGA
jgi:amidohydrolase family protein